MVFLSTFLPFHGIRIMLGILLCLAADATMNDSKRAAFKGKVCNAVMKENRH